MRARDRVVGSLETVYSDAFGKAEGAGDEAVMRRLDFDFQRDQVFLEVLLDIRELLALPGGEEGEKEASLLERAQKLRNLTRLR